MSINYLYLYGNMPRRKIEEKFEISDDAIGVASIRKSTKIGSGTIYFDKRASEEIGGREIRFNRATFSIHITEYEGGGTKPTLVNGNYILYISTPADFDEYGYYEMVWEENKYKLYKIEE